LIGKDKTFYLESLGCNKNTVDSEILLTLLKERGFSRVDIPEKADHIIVNTCAFIDEAKQEAIDVIFNIAHHKKPKAQLIVTGCFPQLYSNEILDAIPEVDVVAGSANIKTVLEAIEKPSGKRDLPESRRIPATYTDKTMRRELLTRKGFAYIKIAEGCSRGCSFCLIPHIKGEMRSRKLQEIVEEAQNLEEKGVKELIITSQDTLSYGNDIGIKKGLSELIHKLLQETGLKYIRLLYLRPGKDLLKNLHIFQNDRVVPYFDIPIQHVSRGILKNMNREGDAALYENVVETIRGCIERAILRTTVITGFPGESEVDFEELKEFISRIQFNHLGVFVFSPQRETKSAGLGDRIESVVAKSRKEKILSLQQSISRELLKKEVGKYFDVLIEEKIKGSTLYFGRSYHFAPEVDGVFVVKSQRIIENGSVINAKVTSSDDYDLHGRETR
jgi:ribosomal protein S12 methylthiotransferase